jgi:hypothetical protein
MDLTEGSETSAKLNLTPGKYPKEHIQVSLPSLKDPVICPYPEPVQSLPPAVCFLLTEYKAV